ncbi:F0F1 ATP synthase subunit B [Campylobacter novaezeelandiae]|uniref:ATP synthase subunit b n=1 Tax=Campylobacter novaezeelandiae TaxID=2267891 RepID=A0A4Q9JV99_9BACT|nr:F0F1 ATP synthase subunit B [Campylobacter novaezeelandiae]QWU79470.1 ATP synthase, F0 complex, b subunit [Campylobacter novaezeelandiae]TBR79265.1 F0F1 ATP synthase subunit B [Campylobacter novaezeelandiae]TBR81974.1 F0F1 ATP synthase subunit B [Campylobacter novaezeelandiae]
MQKLKFLLFLLPVYVLGSPSGNGDYDIIPRVVNFLIFIAILYYFIATPLKNFYKNRIFQISSKLDEIQRKLLESKTKKFEMAKKLEEAKIEASNALNHAKKEVEILVQKVKDEAQHEINLLNKYFEEQKNYEIKKIEKEVISQILSELFKESNTILKQDDMIDIIMKKVS